MQKIYLAYLNTFTFSCIQMVLYTTIPYIAEKTAVETASIIGAIGVGSFIFSFMGPFWAAKSDRLGRKKVLSFGMLGMSLSFALLSAIFIFNDTLSVTVKLSFVFLSRILYGFLCSAIVPVSQAWQLDFFDKENHLKVLTRNSMCLNLGRIMGPILVLAKQVNFELVIYGATLWVFILAIFVFFISTHEKKESNYNVKEYNIKEIILRWRMSIRESLLPILLALVFTSFIGVLHSFLGHHIKNVLDLSGQEATLMFAKIILVLSITVIFLQQLSLILMKSNWKPRVIIGSVAMVIGAFVMMEAQSEMMIWSSIFFICISTALIPPAYLTLTSQSQENTDKTNVFGKKLGLASVAHSLGYALGFGLIAISMKMKMVPESAVVFLISFSILLLSFNMILSQPRRSHVTNHS